MERYGLPQNMRELKMFIHNNDIHIMLVSGICFIEKYYQVYKKVLCFFGKMQSLFKKILNKKILIFVIAILETTDFWGYVYQTPNHMAF